MAIIYSDQMQEILGLIKEKKYRPMRSPEITSGTNLNIKISTFYLKGVDGDFSDVPIILCPIPFDICIDRTLIQFSQKITSCMFRYVLCYKDNDNFISILRSPNLSINNPIEAGAWTYLPCLINYQEAYNTLRQLFKRQFDEHSDHYSLVKKISKSDDIYLSIVFTSLKGDPAISNLDLICCSKITYYYNDTSSPWEG